MSGGRSAVTAVPTSTGDTAAGSVRGRAASIHGDDLTRGPRSRWGDDRSLAPPVIASVEKMDSPQASAPVASARLVAVRLAGLTDATVDVHLPGGVLRVTFEGPGAEAFLEGPTVEVFSGIWPR